MFQENFSLFQIGGIEAFGEPVVDFRKHRACFIAAALVVRREKWHIPQRYWRGGVLSLAGLGIVIGTIVFVQHLSLKPPRTSASIPPQENPALPLPRIPSIAVLPFTNVSGDPQQEYFSDGISDQLINELSRLPGLLVIARNSSFAYKGRVTKEHEIGGELGVKYMLEGSVRKAAEQVRIGVELVDASSGTEMWTQRFDRPLKDIFAVQDEIVGKVVTTLGLIFKREEFPRFCTHVACERNRFAEVALSRFCLSQLESQFTADPQRLGPVCNFVGICTECLFDRLQGVDDAAFARLRLCQTGAVIGHGYALPGLKHASYSLTNQRDSLGRPA